MTLQTEPQPAPRPLRWPDFLPELSAILGSEAEGVYLVGGIVRDAFWGLPAHDVDLAVASNAFRVARQIANQLDGAFYKLDPERETGRAIVDLAGRQLVIDVANFRGPSLLDDLTGRDFTLNAVAAPLTADPQVIVDPLNGLADARDRILRRCDPTSISSDPVRTLRAVRMAVRFSLRIEPDTLADIRREGPRLASASPERVRDEFTSLLDGKRPAAGLRSLNALGLLPIILPEVTTMEGVNQSPPHHTDVWNHTLQVVEKLDGVLSTIGSHRTDNTAAQAGLGMIVYYLDTYRTHLQDHIATRWPNNRSHRSLLMLAALLHDSGKPSTQTAAPEGLRFLGHEREGAKLAVERGEALRLSRDEITRLESSVLNHMRPHTLFQQGEPSRRAIYRFWRDTGPAGVDVCLLALADYLATAGTQLDIKQWSAYLLHIKTLLEGALAADSRNVTALPALITGRDLMRALNLQPGPRIGELLEEIREAQAEGLISSADEALTYLRNHHT